MSAAPFMQLYVGDYLADTIDLTTEQHGAYLLLLMAMWRADGSLPDDPKKLARFARVHPPRWAKVWAEIERFFVVEHGRVTNARLTKEREKAVHKSISRAASGSLGGKAKALKENEKHLANATVLPEHGQISEPEPEIEHEGKPSCNATLFADPELPPEIKSKPEPKARLPADWALSDEGWAYARSQQIPDKVIEDEAKGFHAYWSDRRDRDASKSARGWEQCWANRCRNVAQRYQRSGFMAGQAQTGRSGSGGSIASIVAQRWLGGSHG